MRESTCLLALQAATASCLALSGGDPPEGVRFRALLFVGAALLLAEITGTPEDKPLIVASMPAVLAACWALGARKKKGG